MWLWALAACNGGDVPQPATAPPPFEPVAVGFAFDGVLRADGTLAGYTVDGTSYEPAMVLVFASEAYFTGAAADANSCVALGAFAPSPALTPLPTIDDTVLAVSYETTLSMEAHNCEGRVPASWGVDAQDLWGPFDGARFGYGLSALTPFLEESWSPDTLAEFGDSMLASWIALNDIDGNWVAADWTTAVVFEWDVDTGEVATTIGDDGSVILVPVDAASALEAGSLPEGLLRSYPSWYQDFPLIDFDNL